MASWSQDQLEIQENHELFLYRSLLNSQKKYPSNDSTGVWILIQV